MHSADEASEGQQVLQTDGRIVSESEVGGSRLCHPDRDIEPPAVDALVHIERRRSRVDDRGLKLHPVERMKPVSDRDTSSATGFLCEVSRALNHNAPLFLPADPIAGSPAWRRRAAVDPRTSPALG